MHQKLTNLATHIQSGLSQLFSSEECDKAANQTARLNYIRKVLFI
jgi:hypothetical protein